MINKNIINDAYPLHRIDDQIDSMFGFAWFTTLDLTKCHHHMNLDVSSCEYMAFTTTMGMNQWKVLPMVRRLTCRISTLDVFSSGDSLAKDCRSVH